MINVKKENNLDTIFEIFANNTFIRKHFLLDKDIKKYAQKIKENGFLFIAQKDGNLIGFICGYANDVITKKAYISFLFIKESNGFQNAIGIKKLLDESKKYIKKKGMKYIRAEVDNENIHAVRIYESIGFIEKEKASDKSHYIELYL